MTQPILFRKRIIPDECVRLGDDQILYVDDDIIVTGWKALRQGTPATISTAAIRSTNSLTQQGNSSTGTAT